MKKKLNELLRILVDEGGSDLHLQVGERPIIRLHGALKRLNYDILTKAELEDMLFGIMTEERKQRFLETLELDMSYALDTLARFRVNIFKQRYNIGAVFRLIPFKIQTIDELGLPIVLKDVCKYKRGLVLVTGPTGAGKSTTLAACIEYINTTRRCNIITIEDPIEFLHTDKLSTISQREIGIDAPSFSVALKHVMRENPDIILVGEMRDLETMQAAITAAETGTLVFATLHTNNATQTIDRIIDSFPTEEQQQIRFQLANVISAIFSQILLPKATGEGRVAAFEIMIATPAIKTILREGKTHQIYSIIQSGGSYKMQTLDQALIQLCMQGIVSYEDALVRAPDSRQFTNIASKYIKVTKPI
jgi:twitching motility protein PilT